MHTQLPPESQHRHLEFGLRCVISDLVMLYTDNFIIIDMICKQTFDCYFQFLNTSDDATNIQCFDNAVIRFTDYSSRTVELKAYRNIRKLTENTPAHNMTNGVLSLRSYNRTCAHALQLISLDGSGNFGSQHICSISQKIRGPTRDSSVFGVRHTQKKEKRSKYHLFYEFLVQVTWCIW